MSCGLTATTSVAAFFVGLLGRYHRHPVGRAQLSPRASRRTTTATSDGGRPARSRPDSSASPIFPVPSIAIMRSTIAND